MARACVCVSFLLFPPIPFGGLIGRLGLLLHYCYAPGPQNVNIYWKSCAPKFWEVCVPLFQDQCSLILGSFVTPPLPLQIPIEGIVHLISRGFCASQYPHPE